MKFVIKCIEQGNVINCIASLCSLLNISTDFYYLAFYGFIPPTTMYSVYLDNWHLFPFGRVFCKLSSHTVERTITLLFQFIVNYLK